MDALDQWSQRFIALDPSGYFLIKRIVMRPNWCLSLRQTIDDSRGPEIRPGEVLTGAIPRRPSGFTAANQQLHPAHGREATPGQSPRPCHLGRDQKAEQCLRDGTVYVQDCDQLEFFGCCCFWGSIPAARGFPTERSAVLEEVLVVGQHR